MSIQLNLAKCIKRMRSSMLYLPTNVCKSVCNVALEMNQFLIKTTERENDLPKRQFGMHRQRERIAFTQEATAIWLAIHYVRPFCSPWHDWLGMNVPSTSQDFLQKTEKRPEKFQEIKTSWECFLSVQNQKVKVQTE